MRRALFLLLMLGCGGNPYGYGPEYVALGDEEPHQERALALSYEDVRRDPLSHKDRTLGWFGVVESVKPVPGKDQWLVGMQLRFHQPRHLCTDQFDSSCRVTISEKEGGPWSALLTPHAEDRAGKLRLGPGSLVKVYGRATPDHDERGGPIVTSDYYRHWPHGQYVNTARSRNMRR